MTSLTSFQHNRPDNERAPSAMVEKNEKSKNVSLLNEALIMYEFFAKNKPSCSKAFAELKSSCCRVSIRKNKGHCEESRVERDDVAVLKEEIASLRSQ